MSNFNVAELEILLAHAKVKPVANQVRCSVPPSLSRRLTRKRGQILFHPYVLARQGPIVEFGNKHGIVSEAYSALMCVSFLPPSSSD